VLGMGNNSYRILRLLLLLASASIPMFYLISLILGYGLQFWITITHLGDKELYIALLPIIYHGISRSLGIEILMIFSTSMWFGNMLKNLLRMPRPPEELWKINVEGFGFPSGHAQGSTTFWGFISAKYRDLVITLFTIVLVTFVSLSRVILGVHYIHDVIGGVAIGVTIVTISIIVKRRLRNMNYRVLRLLIVMYSVIFLILPLFLNISTDIDYMISGIILGAGLGHIELTRVSKARKTNLGLLERTIGSIMGLVIGGIGYLSIEGLSGIYLYIGYALLSFIIIYPIGIFVNMIGTIRHH